MPSSRSVSTRSELMREGGELTFVRLDAPLTLRFRWGSTDWIVHAKWMNGSEGKKWVSPDPGVKGGVQLQSSRR